VARFDISVLGELNLRPDLIWPFPPMLRTRTRNNLATDFAMTLGSSSAISLLTTFLCWGSRVGVHFVHRKGDPLGSFGVERLSESWRLTWAGVKCLANKTNGW